MGHVFDRNSRCPQTVLDRLRRKPGAMLDPIETLLFGGGDDFAVLNQSCGRVAVISVNSEDVHIQISDCCLWAAEPGNRLAGDSSESVLECGRFCSDLMSCSSSRSDRISSASIL